jgi:hypothetical protein
MRINELLARAQEESLAAKAEGAAQVPVTLCMRMAQGHV